MLFQLKKVQAMIISWLVLLLFPGGLKAQPQYEKKISGLPLNYVAAPLTETYDNALLVLALDIYDEDFLNPCYIIKLNAQGTELWRKSLNNLLNIEDVIATKDSGFVVAVTLNVDPSTDTIRKAALVKFDKCGNIKWAKYLNTPESFAVHILEGVNDVLFLCAGNGFDDRIRKPVNIIKFDSGGNLMDYASFEGIPTSRLYNGYYKGELYINLDIYLPLDKNDSSTVYAFTCIKKLDTSLHTLSKTVIAYKERILSFPGPLIIQKNSITEIAIGFKNNEPARAMFAAMDTALKPTREFIFDAEPKYNLSPNAVVVYGDTIIVSNHISNTSFDSTHTSLRMYNSRFELLKEVKINRNWRQDVGSFFQLKNGNMLQNINDISPTSGKYTSSNMYIFDRYLNPVPWPTEPPAMGYDWACNNTIPANEIIDVNTIAEPVHIEQDTSRPDWSWLDALSVREPERESIGRISRDWFVWPQPALQNDVLHIKSLQSLKLKNNSKLQAVFYDMQGRKQLSTNAEKEGENTWLISNVNQLKAGIYLVHLSESNSGSIVGSIKIVIQ